jgi:hypothetical protein
LEDPTYQDPTYQEFWKSRNTPRKIQIVSTDISKPSGSSVLGGLNSSQVSLDLDEGLLEIEVCDIGEDCQERSEDQEFSDPAMSPTLERSAAESSLRLLDTKGRDM